MHRYTLRLLAVALITGCGGGLFLLSSTAMAAPAEKSRVFVLTDIANEPDDEESFVRFLLYSNEFDVEGMAATTSTWLKDRVYPERLVERVEAYGQVLANLRKHDSAYPDLSYLRARISAGPAVYGMRGVGSGRDSAASEALIAAVDRPDPRPLWVSVWGGANVLAQALWKVEHTRTPEQLKAFAARLRVYSISDQDDTGPWLRSRFPSLFWIASIHAFSHYSGAAWTGMSGEEFYHFSGPDSSKVSHQWLAEHIRKGPLGSLYPDYKFIMEGDTPAFLYLLNNGVNSPEHPDYGGWGGRYGAVAAGMGLYADVVDNVVGADGRVYRGSEATVWRWRDAVQNDFAARVQWSLSTDYQQANHNPLAVINSDAGKAALRIAVRPGEEIDLDASASSDPDGDTLSYRWWQYKEAGATHDAMAAIPDLLFSAATSARTKVTVPSKSGHALQLPQELHLVLEVLDNGKPRLSSYRRVVITVLPKS